MAEVKSTRLFLVGRPTDPPKPSALNAKSIAAEALTIARECARQLHEYHAQTEIALGEIAGLLDALEIEAIRALHPNASRAKGDA